MQSNREIELVQYLNNPVLRYDPWNPAPPLLSIVNDDNHDSDEPLAIFDPLVAYDSKPLSTVEEALDLMMQLLQVRTRMFHISFVFSDPERRDLYSCMRIV
jgi:hypothetical protein